MMRKKFVTIFLIIALAFGAIGCEETKFSGNFLMSLTKLSNFSGGNENKAKKNIFNFLGHLEDSISLNVKGSYTNQINSAKAGERIQVDEHSYIILKRALELYDLTQGAFNPFVLNLSTAWGFGDNATIPKEPLTDEEIAPLKSNILPKKASDNIVLDDKKGVTKMFDDVVVDLGAIAKGYAAGVSANLAQKRGVKSGIINIAGNIYVLGEKSAGTGFTIGITDPRYYLTDEEYFAKMLLKNTSVSVSGDYERSYYLNKKLYCHIIDPFTGRPVDNGVMSVVIVTDRATDADALTTATMVKGAIEGKKFLESQGLSGCIIMDDFTYHLVGDMGIIQGSIGGGYRIA